jgi:2-polyprenyl-3-methyl-5-hydroxy-6-metoxy-1,4-benzoquinol methylase
MTPPYLPYIASRIAEAEPKYGRKLHETLQTRDALFFERAESFLSRYADFLAARGQTIDFGVECYLKLRKSMLAERMYFLRTGKYRSNSFEEVNQRVYGNPEAMQTHMHGLVLAQFLWPDQYRRFEFFSDNLFRYKSGIASYLEVGGGHALYVTEADRQLPPGAEIEVVDISPSSLELAQGIAREPRIRFHLMNIFDYRGQRSFDFITMGEVLEHVEQPLELLRCIADLLAPEGRAYITTPANAPTLDHIYLFRNAEEIRSMLRQGGFEIEQETTDYGSDLPPSQAEKLKIALMYAAFVRKT